MNRIRHIDGHDIVSVSGWQLCATAPDAVSDPRSPELAWSGTALGPATTAAAMLRALGQFSLEGSSRRFDGEEWWFKAAIPAIEHAPGDEIVLRVDGIATIADVWIDGDSFAPMEGMFRTREIPLPHGGGELVLRCKSLDAVLAGRRPRPRWKTPMIENQQLRWFRTTLLGRTPGWSPSVAPVGPWRGVHVEHRRAAAVDGVRLATRVEGTDGVLDVSCRVRALGTHLGPITVVVSRDGHESRATMRSAETPEGESFGAVLTIPNVAKWWPHTHGEPSLYSVKLQVGTMVVDLGQIGFRTLTRASNGDGFGLVVNGVPVFCRGACWTPLDVVTMTADRPAYERALRQVRDAGMNMIRVGGTMVYESDDFYDLCDELGILLWHDFMFANMDYPEEHEPFVAEVVAETREFLDRMQGRPSLAVLCGNSEGEQQAAMFGAARDRWSPKLFHEVLANESRERCPDVLYWPSSAHGGAFPHEPRVGTTSYYGVGAYLRPLEDARRAEVRFATECLAFANVPEHTPPGTKVHHPAWKARTPRDLGAGWDFDDVRDHYVQRLFGVDPVAVRYADHDRYLDLGRAAVGEVMAATFGEWRRQGSTCRGGIVWFLRDFWAGSGWGVVGADGTPKSVYWYLKRALAPVAVHLTDEGNNGLYVHVANDRPEVLACELEIALYRSGEVVSGKGKRALEVPAHGAISRPAMDFFEGFMDLSNAFRFGPPLCDVAVATLTSNAARAQTFHFPVGVPSSRDLDLGLVATAQTVSEGVYDVTIKTRRFAQCVRLDAEGYAADDAWFHLAPGDEKTLRVTRTSGSKPLKGALVALNFDGSAKIVVA